MTTNGLSDRLLPLTVYNVPLPCRVRYGVTLPKAGPCQSLLLFFCEGENELQSSARTVFGGDGAPVYEDCVFHNGQSQAGTAQFARTPFVYAVEALKQAVQMFGGYAYTCVGKAEIIEILVFAEAGDVDAYVGARIGYGIVHQIAEDRVEQRIVATQLYLGLQ